ncbi:MAG: hypothetical protein HYW24_04090 [Candidatus Aenigmarchaeota archaeon]|nr:hypothetical protein [Candidatus Aenigmarchaeota archaeon]
MSIAGTLDRLKTLVQNVFEKDAIITFDNLAQSLQQKGVSEVYGRLKVYTMPATTFSLTNSPYSGDLVEYADLLLCGVDSIYSQIGIGTFTTLTPINERTSLIDTKIGECVQTFKKYGISVNMI